MRDTVTVLLFVIICLLTAALVFLVYKYKKMNKMADKTMAQMDDMMEQLILGREVKYFSENEDTLPGKFQSQAGRLYGSTERRRKEKSCSGIRSAARSATWCIRSIRPLQILKCTVNF